MMLAASWQLLPPGGAVKFLLSTRGWLLLMYGQPACGACRAWHGILPGWLPEGWQLAYVDVSVDAAQAARHDVFHLPAFMIYRDGEFHARLAAPMNERAFGEALSVVCALPAEDEP